MMAAEHVNLLINAGIAGVFAVFAILLFDRFTKFLDRQNEQWREFLKNERIARSEATARLAEEMKLLAQETAAIKALMITHDQRVQMAIPRMDEAVQQINKSPSRRKAG